MPKINRLAVLAVVSGVVLTASAHAEAPAVIRGYYPAGTPTYSVPPTAFQAPAASVRIAPQVPVTRGRYGGGFIEFLMTGQSSPRAQAVVPAYNSPVQVAALPSAVAVSMETTGSIVDPQFRRQDVAYDGAERPGTIVIDTPHKFLFLVEPNGRALRYGIGVGRPGFEWAGMKVITRKAEWPTWTPPADMLLRRPSLPRQMPGGPNNPLGARALYLGSSMYRIHGTNEPTTIGKDVSSGCIRMMNEDVEDLYDRVGVGTKVLVM